MARRSTVTPKLPPRPRRGLATDTRDRLVVTGAEVFNRDGYDGTDSNRIAREAGYAPGTFYKHFPDKKQLFLAVYDEWVSREWREVSATLSRGGAPGDRAVQIVDMFLEHHRRWRGFRASLRALVSTDVEVRRFYVEQRNRQLELLPQLRREFGGREATREDDAALLFLIERSADALADGEADALRLDARGLRQLLVSLVTRELSPER